MGTSDGQGVATLTVTISSADGDVVTMEWQLAADLIDVGEVLAVIREALEGGDHDGDC